MLEDSISTINLVIGGSRLWKIEVAIIGRRGTIAGREGTKGSANQFLLRSLRRRGRDYHVVKKIGFSPFSCSVASQFPSLRYLVEVLIWKENPSISKDFTWASRSLLKVKWCFRPELTSSAE
ncbi:hypothetical protein NE237_026217 [Protea cynaroides]|uniref:Uncharacterized protein n=1 Tax=Protea cynaroides TaxID=273540 RepID=A0A9Q0H3C3_9MAGN|nr:hypothetical protein NE237_026217 [Protea cynaroides]